MANRDAQFVVTPPPATTVRVQGGGAFPVRRVFCVGRNYADHVVEMGGDVTRNPPTFFTKPADAVVCEPKHVPYPKATSNLHYEVEWVVALYAGGSDLDTAAARKLVGASGVGLDLTRRDLQAAAKKAGDPWDCAKAFDQSAPISALRAGTLDDIPAASTLSLRVNDDTRQSATLEHLIWSVPELLSHLSGLFELKAGDLIFTGTPAGVGPLHRGDRVAAALEGIAEFQFEMA
ncbi:MAG: fumarylacetoacetate hydrolase family protein [Gammaproteobacteria bacterium]